MLTKIVSALEIFELETLLMTSDNNLVCKGTEQLLSQCNHEEVDGHMLVHVRDYLERGDNSMIVCTVNADISCLL